MLRLCGVAVISVISILGTLFWSDLRSFERSQVPLTAGLHGAWAAISEEFDRRVKNRFPLGSTEKDMALELRREGFSRQDWESSVDLEHQATRDESRFPCNQRAQVFWRADAEGRLTAIRGEYPMGECL
jgi:hypothetical protein